MRIRCLDSDASPAPAARPGSRVLLMSTAWSGSAEDFRPLFRLLPPGVRAVAVDLPAAASPPGPMPPTTSSSFLRSCAHSLKRSGWTGSCSLATPWAGSLPRILSPGWPGLVDRLILIAPYGLEGQEGVLAHPREVGRIPGLCLPSQFAFFIRWMLRVNVLYGRPRRGCGPRWTPPPGASWGGKAYELLPAPRGA